MTFFFKKAVTAGQIVVGNETGYEPAKAGVKFSSLYPVLMQPYNTQINTNRYDTYFAIESRDARVTRPGWIGTAKKLLYLVGTIDGNEITIADEVLASDIPWLDTGKVYIPLGIQYSTTHFYFNPSNNMYQYKNGRVTRV